MDLGPFDQAGEVVRALTPSELGAPRVRARRYGLKVWFGGTQPARQHYEAQVIGAALAPGASVLALEVGFHLEERDPAVNDAVMARLGAVEVRWKRALGAAAEAGPFLGRPDDWRRLSETWPDPDLDDPELGFAVGARLVDYVTVLEPLLR